jgi:hypothetical protein
MISTEEQEVFTPLADHPQGILRDVVMCALQGTIFPSVKVRPG